MQNKFKYWLVLLLSVSFNGVTSAMETSGAAGVAGSHFTDRDVSDAKSRYQKSVRHLLRVTFGTMFTDSYISSNSEEQFVAEFNRRADSQIRPLTIGNCSCCPTGRNELVYKHIKAKILNTALEMRVSQISLIKTNTYMWQAGPHVGDPIIQVTPLDDFVVESEKRADMTSERLYVAATRIQTAFHDHKLKHARAVKSVRNTR